MIFNSKQKCALITEADYLEVYLVNIMIGKAQNLLTVFVVTSQ